MFLVSHYNDEMIDRVKLRNIGIILAVLGVLAILLPQLTSTTIAFIVGVIVFFSGSLTAYYNFKVNKHNHKGLLLTAIYPALAIIGGIVLMTSPGVGAFALTAFVGVYFLLVGLNKFICGLSCYRVRSTPWLFLSAFLESMVGLFIIYNWAALAPWLIGLLVGISLIVNGIWFFSLGDKSDRISEA